MKKILLILFAISTLFGVELWQQRHDLDKAIFQKQMSLLSNKKFDPKEFDFFIDTAKQFDVYKELQALIEANNMEDYLKTTTKFIASLESNAYDKKAFDLIDMLDCQENVKKEVLFAKKIKKAYITLEKSNLKFARKPLEQLFFIQEYLKIVNKKIDSNLANSLKKAIDDKNRADLQKYLKELEKKVLTLKSEQIPKQQLEQYVKSFVRYNKLVAFDYSNGVDDEANIKNSLEYTEAVAFSAKAKQILLTIHGNLSQKDFKQLLKIYAKIIDDIQKKINKKEVSSLTKQAKKIILAATGLKEVKETPKEIVSHIVANLDLIKTSVIKKDFKQAEFLRLESYSFFDPDIEVRLKPRNPALTTELEGLFWDGYNQTKGLGYSIKHKDKRSIYATINQLKIKLNIAQKELESKLSYSNSMVQSMMIIVREGLEAVLVLAVLLTLFTSKKSKLYLLGGVLLGIFATTATYYVAKEILTISTSNRELIEGGSALLAAIMLIFVTAWIFHNTYVKGWVAYAKKLTDKSIQSGSVITLLIIGFLVVYREGFETVLFYEALAQESNPQAVWFGFLIGLFVIVAISIMLVKGIKKLPINLFFSVTGLLLSMLAVIFIGAGIRGLQTANILSATPSQYLQNWQFLRNYFGYSPTIETTLVQVLVALILFGFYAYSKNKKIKS